MNKNALKTLHMISHIPKVMELKQQRISHNDIIKYLHLVDTTAVDLTRVLNALKSDKLVKRFSNLTFFHKDKILNFDITKLEKCSIIFSQGIYVTNSNIEVPTKLQVTIDNVTSYTNLPVDLIVFKWLSRNFEVPNKWLILNLILSPKENDEIKNIPNTILERYEVLNSQIKLLIINLILEDHYENI